MDDKIGSLDHVGDDGVEVFLFDVEFLKIFDCFIFALGGDLLYMKSKVFKKFMHIHIPLQYKYRPSIRTRMPTHQSLETLQVNITQVIHSTVNLRYVNTEYC